MITRWLAASLFFVGLVVVWHFVVKAQIWSPLLLPSPASVLEYLRTAAQDGTLWEATVVTVRRLLIGYGLGILVGLPLGLLTASFTMVPRHDWHSRLRAPDTSQCLLGAVGPAVVRAE